MTEINTNTTNSERTDCLQRFLFEQAAVRGEWVHLSESWQQILQRQTYPLAVRQLLGELVAAAALFVAMVKMKGRLVMQVRASGPVRVLMVECTSEQTLRAIAKWDGEIQKNATLAELTGDGVLALTLDVEGAKQPYQGLITLTGKSITALLENYFRQSEQLETRLWLAVDDHTVAGLLLQQVPDSEVHQDSDDWNRLTQLADTVRQEELLHLDSQTLLYRLFHEDQCRIFTSIPFKFACQCSRERVAKTILMLGEADANQILQSRGKIEVACEFCNQHYHFDKVDVHHLFATQRYVDNAADTQH